MRAGTPSAQPAAALPVAPPALPGYAWAKRHGMLVSMDGAHALVRHRGTPEPQALSELARVLGCALHLEALSDAEFARALAAAYGDNAGGGAQATMEDLGDGLDLAAIASSLPEPEDLLESQDDAPIIRLINAILAQAVREGASDVHLESFETRLSVRLRVDGMLREILEPPRALAGTLVSRIKVMARLDIAEKRLPQDGRISLRIAGRPVDVRVSTLPSGYGERVVLRLLDRQAGRLDLGGLGVAPATRERFAALIREPHGILLITGPTGSGKTTSLYALLTELNDRKRNILTVEDPIEYFLDGIGQTQVNPKIDLDFARGLRAILRQDPDVVMVGEIRDLETAEIAVQASLTGHLVLSTLHTNTAIGAITRLRDMGVEPYLLATSLIGVAAQRLVRLLCPHCKRRATATPGECAQLGLAPTAPPALCHPVGCERCHGNGYIGRSGIYEVSPIDATLARMIHDGAADADMERYARSLSPGIRSDGLQRVLAGDTSLEELLRVTRAGS
ncbi:type II secretion system ATPase GspE [Metallibacterium scheffleri]|uniref:Type II secretion system protein E n=1 Tax=Metallibacterium scheffleri TaxID=993689 RepID=A0A4S3KRA3_9GAMM|nr:type II secretion system ATPase GspE [Metallibacterium scheffleri]THD11582.1 type II secretion system protein GspE [Metallibacterium scheffleri]